MKTAIFSGFFVAVAGFLVGMEVGWRQREAEPDKIVTLTRTCKPDRPNVRWLCDAVERREYLNVCLKRKAT